MVFFMEPLFVWSTGFFGLIVVGAGITCLKENVENLISGKKVLSYLLAACKVLADVIFIIGKRDWAVVHCFQVVY